MSGLATDVNNPARQPGAPHSAEAPSDPIAESLWRQWKAGERPDVDAFVSAAGPLTSEQLLAVLEVDQRERWRLGDRVSVETYLRNFPFLATDPRAFSLVLGELSLRHAAGDPGRREEYLRRFPEFARQLGLLSEPAGATVADCGLDATQPADPPARPNDVRTVRLRIAPPPDSAGLPPPEPPADSAPDDPPNGQRIGPYEIVGVLARGGMGVVYRALDVHLKRTVALKMILSEARADADAFARFRAEAEAVARLQHPNIVQIYQVGEHDGLPYIALEYIEGRNLHEVVDEAPLPPASAADLMRTVARAIEFAHQRGIVHRDLKPGNILLQKHEGRETKVEQTAISAIFSSAALRPSPVVPKVTDFGLAKLYKDADIPGRPGEVIGTPNYMAPEQADGAPEGIGPAADVYSLGAVLYEALTGQPPYGAGSPMETLMRVRLSKLVPPRHYAPHVPPDLETICLKCLRRDRQERYPSAAALADDLDRYLTGRPVLARPVGRAEQAWKWGRRHPAVATLAGMLAVLFIVANAVIVYLWRDAVAAREEADDNLTKLRDMQRQEGLALRTTQDAWAVAQRKQYAMQLLAAETEWMRLDAAAARRTLHAAAAEYRSWEWRYLDRLFQGSGLTITAPASCQALHVLPDNHHFAALGADGALRTWELATGKAVRLVALARDGAFPADWGFLRAEFSRDGRWVAGAASPPAGASPQATPLVGVWEVSTGRLIRTWPCDEGAPVRLAFSADARQLVSVSGVWVPTRGTDSGEWRGGVVRVVSVADGATRFERKTDGDGACFVDAAFSPGGDRLALTRKGQGLLVVDLATGAETLRAGDGLEGQRVWYLAKGAGHAVLSGHEFQMFDPDGKLTHSMNRRRTGIERVFFSPDRDRVVFADAFNTVRVFDATARRKLCQLVGHTNWVSLAVVSPDNQALVTCAQDNTLKVWNLNQSHDPPAVGDGEYAEGTWVPALSFDQTGGRLFVGSDDHRLRAFDVATRKKVGEWTVGDARSLVLSPDGKTLAVGFDEKPGYVGLFDLATEKLRYRIKAHDDSVTRVVFNPDGTRLASASEDGTAKVWDAATGTEVTTCRGHAGAVYGIAFHPNGRRLATVGRDGTLRIWDSATGEQTRLLYAHESPATCVAISPDARWVATANANRDRRHVATEIRIWNASTGDLMHTLTGHTNSIWHVAFSPDSKRLASAGEDGTVRIWDPAHGDLLLSMKRHFDDIRAIAFSRDGHRLASSGDDPFVRVWDATPLP